MQKRNVEAWPGQYEVDLMNAKFDSGGFSCSLRYVSPVSDLLI